MKVRKVIAPAIYLMDNGSFRVVARVGDRKNGPRPKEKRFPAGTPLKKLKAWQEDQRAELRRTTMRPVLGTLAADHDRHIKSPAVTGLASHKTRISDLGAWLPRFG